MRRNWSGAECTEAPQRICLVASFQDLVEKIFPKTSGKKKKDETAPLHPPPTKIQCVRSLYRKNPRRQTEALALLCAATHRRCTLQRSHQSWRLTEVNIDFTCHNLDLWRGDKAQKLMPSWKSDKETNGCTERPGFLSVRPPGTSSQLIERTVNRPNSAKKAPLVPGGLIRHLQTLR